MTFELRLDVSHERGSPLYESPADCTRNRPHSEGDLLSAQLGTPETESVHQPSGSEVGFVILPPPHTLTPLAQLDGCRQAHCE